MNTMKKNKGAVKTANASTINKQGNPAKASKEKIDAYCAESLLRSLFGVPNNVPRKVKLGKNEVALMNKMAEKHERAMSKSNKGKKCLYTLTSVSLGEGKVRCVEPRVYKNETDAVNAMREDLINISNMTIPANVVCGHRKAKRGFWEVNLDGIASETDDNAIAKCYNADSGFGCTWYLEKHYV